MSASTRPPAPEPVGEREAPTPPVAIAVPAIGDRVRFGSGDDNDVVLRDPAIARDHAEVSASADGLRLRDLTTEPDHGTRLNGQLVAGALLTDGDVIGIGPWAIEVRGRELVPRLIDAPPLETRQVAVVVDGTYLLQPTDLTFGSGELVAVIGPSGAGKSTLLKVLAGLSPASSGQVLLHGDNVVRRQADLGFVPQEDTVHRLLSAREALTFAARLRLPAGQQDRDDAVDAALAEVQLSHKADQRIATMSGGQRKRVSLAQELVSRPSVLLLDEPTSGLDPGLDHRMMQLLRSLADGGRSVVVVTHSVSHLDECDRVLVMAPGGRVAYAGSPAELATAFGAETIAEVFDLMTEESEPVAVPAPAELPEPEAMTGRVIARRRGLAAQTTILTSRSALLTLRDRRNLRLLAIQALGLSIGAALLFGHDVFRFRNGVARHAGESAQLLFLMVTMAMWFGAVCSARQIVAERSVLARDLASGVSTEAYLMSKAIVLGVVAATQTIVMALVVFVLRPLGAAPGEAQVVVLLLVLVAWVGVALGLLVSAYAGTEDQATTYIPLVLLPQLLFGGAIVPTAQLSGLMAGISHLAAAQWAFAGVGHAIHMNDRIAGDAAFASASRYGQGFFQLGSITASIALLVFIGACAVLLQARLRPSIEDTWWTQARVWNRARRHDELARATRSASAPSTGAELP